MVAQLTADYIRTRPLKAANRLISHLLLQGRPLTTGYRWLNPWLLAQFALVRRLPKLKTVEKPIFILGTGRSGSTVLGSILSLHRDIVFLNEAKALWHAAYAAEDLIGSYGRGAAHYRLDGAQATPEVQQALHRLYGYSLFITGSRRVLDKHGEMIFRIPFVRAVFPDAKLIFLVRNGGDTLRSIADWSRRYGLMVDGERHDWWGADGRKWRLLVEQIVPHDPALAAAYPEISQFTRDEDKAAVEWIASMREGLRLMEESPGLLHLVRYEDLTKQPQETLQALLAHCDLPDDPVMLAYATRIMTPAVPKAPISLAPVLESTFHKTIQALNYPAGEIA